MLLWVQEVKDAKADDGKKKATPSSSSSSKNSSGSSSKSSSGSSSTAGGSGAWSSTAVDPSSLLGLLDRLRMAAAYFQKCGGKAQSTVTAEEEAGFLQVSRPMF